MGRYSQAAFNSFEVEKSLAYAVRVVEIHETDSCVAITTRRFGGNIGRALEVEQGRCQRVRQSMHALISEVQYYVMKSWNRLGTSLNESFPGAWRMTRDSIIASHENYLNSVIEKALLGTKSQFCNGVYS